MNVTVKRELNNALIRIVPLVLGFAAGKGWLSQDDANTIQEILLILAGLGLTYYASTSRPSVREKLAEDVLQDRQKRLAAEARASAVPPTGPHSGSSAVESESEED